MTEDILLQVRKPARYIGGEWNVSKKHFNEANIRFALCFPDLYEVGMSNLGIRIIYGILNSMEGVVCERFFSPDTDMAGVLKDKGLEIVSLETKKRLKEFDIIGFSLGSELDYTNVLSILDLGNIPLKAKSRDAAFPLVIGGGPCVLNPEPMHEFFDLFVIGEADEAISDIVDAYRKHGQEFKASKMSKQEILLMLSQIEGVYVPSLYEVKYNDSGLIEEFRPNLSGVPLKVKKRFVKDLNSCFSLRDWLVPYIQTIHDRVTVEIMRGCPNKCRFCQARSGYFPYRVKDIKNILDLALDTYRRTGYEEISLGGLSVSDYVKVEELSESLIDLFKTRAVSVSLPSIKARQMVGNLSTIIAKVKKTGLTFAPEAGSEKMRKVLAKDFDEQDFFEAIQQAYLSGYRRIKLYFMIGLPYEEDSDLDGIIDFSTRVSELRRKTNKYPAQVNISVNQFIPKPHTPFQWFGMEDIEAIKYKQDYLRGKIRNKKLALVFHSRQMSFLEGVLSRGDRRLSDVILLAFKRGARFDAWSNYFSFDAWIHAFKEANIDPNLYLRQLPSEASLPWDFIDLGISKEILLSEFKQAGAIH